MEAFKLESLRAIHGKNPTHLSYGKGTTHTNPSTDSRAALYRAHHTLLASYLQEENKHQVLTQKETTSANGYSNHHSLSEL